MVWVPNRELSVGPLAFLSAPKCQLSGRSQLSERRDKLTAAHLNNFCSPGLSFSRREGAGSTFPQQVSHQHSSSRRSPLGALELSAVVTVIWQVLAQHFPDAVTFNYLSNPTLIFRTSLPAGPLYLWSSALMKRLLHTRW